MGGTTLMKFLISLIYLFCISSGNHNITSHERFRRCPFNMKNPIDWVDGIANDFSKANLEGSDKEFTHHYERMYIPFLARFKIAEFSMMEIGIRNGASLKMWPLLFPNVNHVYGMGVDAEVGDHQKIHVINNQITTYDADQSDKTALDFVIGDIGKQLEFILDDGSHYPVHQIFTFEYLFSNLLAPGGIYIIEDIETSYWDGPNAKVYNYDIRDGGPGKPINIVERFKQVADVINRKYFGSPEFSVFKGNVDHMISSISFSRNCIIIQKGDKWWNEENLQTANYPLGFYLTKDKQDIKKFIEEKSLRFPGLDP